MQIKCDSCGLHVNEVGRLTTMKFGGLAQKMCKGCKKKARISFK